MMIDGNGKTEEGLEDTVEMGGFEKIHAADDVSDALKGVIVDDGEVITGADIFADKDSVAEEFGFCLLNAVKGVGPGEVGAGFGEGFFKVEPEGVGRSGGEAGGTFVGGESPAGPGVKGGLAAVGGITGAFDFAKDVVPGAEAGVEEAAIVEVPGGGGEVVTVFALDADGGFPFEPEPGEIVEDLSGVPGAAARGVDILDPQDESSAPRFREGKGGEGRVGVAFVKVPGGARGKTGHDTGFSHGKELLNAVAFLPIYHASVSYPD